MTSYTAQDLRDMAAKMPPMQYPAGCDSDRTALLHVANILARRDHADEIWRGVERALEELDWWHSIDATRRKAIVDAVAAHAPPMTQQPAVWVGGEPRK